LLVVAVVVEILVVGERVVQLYITHHSHYRMELIL
jgi:hypothetical protein